MTIQEHLQAVARAHRPEKWWSPGQFPQCSCGYAPRDNTKLYEHWASQGISWYDAHGQLKWTAASTRLPRSWDPDDVEHWLGQP